MCTSAELNNALIEESIRHLLIAEKSVPIADGGEETLDVFKDALLGEIYSALVPDLCGNFIYVDYFLTVVKGEVVTFIEFTKIIGFDLITSNAQTIQQQTPTDWES